MTRSEPADPAASSPVAFRRCAVVGIGLLGGSFALALRRLCPQVEVTGVARSAASRESALRTGAADHVTDDLADACRDADLVVVATPVDRIAPSLVAASRVCHADALLTDLGSTKERIVAAVAEHPQTQQKFVAAHPIAGSEKTGAENASADLFHGRTVVLTPTDSTDPQRLASAQRLWQGLGSRVITMTPEAHDRAMAAVSHVPHLAASALARLLACEQIDSPPLRSLVGSGWLDTTRVASGDAELWTAICLENREAIVDELTRLEQTLAEFRGAIAGGDTAGLHGMLAAAKDVRDSLLRADGDRRSPQM